VLATGFVAMLKLVESASHSRGLYLECYAKGMNLVCFSRLTISH
jgi:hypothetical protein